MKKKKTERGFSIAEFEDTYGNKCSLQMSSIATEARIWFGVNDANPLVLTGKGWTPVSFPEETLFHTRMHLNQKQVKALLPHLQKFVETGEI